MKQLTSNGSKLQIEILLLQRRRIWQRRIAPSWLRFNCFFVIFLFLFNIGTCLLLLPLIWPKIKLRNFWIIGYALFLIIFSLLVGCFQPKSSVNTGAFGNCFILYYLLIPLNATTYFVKRTSVIATLSVWRDGFLIFRKLQQSKFVRWPLAEQNNQWRYCQKLNNYTNCFTTSSCNQNVIFLFLRMQWINLSTHLSEHFGSIGFMDNDNGHSRFG